MRILGLFIVVFLCLFVNKLLGFEEPLVGVIVGAGVYIISLIPKPN